MIPKEIGKSYTVGSEEILSKPKELRGTQTTMEEQDKSQEINVVGVTCLLVAQMEALIERWANFCSPKNIDE